MLMLAGGKDKGFTYESLRSLVKEKVKACVLIGEMAGRIARDWEGAVKCEIANSLADAVERAHRLAQSGDVEIYIDEYGRRVIVDSFTGEVLVNRAESDVLELVHA